MSFISLPNTPATLTIYSHCRHFTTWGNHFEIGVLIKKCENTNERVMHASDNFIHITEFAGCAINIHQGPSFRYRILPIIWNVVTKILVFVGLTNHIVFLLLLLKSTNGCESFRLDIATKSAKFCFSLANFFFFFLSRFFLQIIKKANGQNKRNPREKGFTCRDYKLALLLANVNVRKITKYFLGWTFLQ